MIKEILETILNESTQAAIIVKIGNTYKTSILQSDGYKEYMKPVLTKGYNSQKDAEKLVQKTGEIRGVNKDSVEYYKDRKLLAVSDDESNAVKDANEVHIKYFWDGDKWNYGTGQIKTFADMKKL